MRDVVPCVHIYPASPVGVLFAPAAVWSKCGSEVDFDELAGESELGHAQERARSGERRSDDRKGELAPGRGKNRVVIAHDVDYRTDDLIRPGADRGEHRSGVGGDLVNLQVDISGADQRTERVERALPRKERETPGLDDCDVMVAGWVVQLCWVVASDHRRHAAHPAPPEKPDATHQRRALRAVDQASLAQRPRENLLAGQPPGNNGDDKQEFVALAKESYCPIS